MPHSISPIITLVWHICHTTNQYRCYYLLKSTFYLDFHCPTAVPGSLRGCHIIFSCHVCLGSCWLWHFLRFFLFWWSQFWEELVMHVFCRLSLKWDLPNYFPTFIPWVSRSKAIEVKYHSHRVVSSIHTINMVYHCLFSLGSLAEEEFVSLLCNVAFPPTCPFHPGFFGRKSLCPSHPWVRIYVVPPWSQNIYKDYFKFFCTRNFSLLPHLFIQDFYVSVDSWIFVLYFGL